MEIYKDIMNIVKNKVAFILIIIIIIGFVFGFYLTTYYKLLGLGLVLLCTYLTGAMEQVILGKEKLYLKLIYKRWEIGIQYIIYLLLLILILLSIGRIMIILYQISISSIYPKANYFDDVSFSFIRTEVGRILYLVILVNIFSLVNILLKIKKKMKIPKRNLIYL